MCAEKRLVIVFTLGGVSFLPCVFLIVCMCKQLQIKIVIYSCVFRAPRAARGPSRDGADTATRDGGDTAISTHQEGVYDDGDRDEDDLTMKIEETTAEEETVETQQEVVSNAKEEAKALEAYIASKTKFGVTEEEESDEEGTDDSSDEDDEDEFTAGPTVWEAAADEEIPENHWEYHMRKSMNDGRGDSVYRNLAYLPVCNCIPVCNGETCQNPYFMWTKKR